MKSLKTQLVIYILIYIKASPFNQDLINKNKAKKDDTTVNIISSNSSVIVPPTLLNKLIDFNNIFLDKEINRLLLYKGGDYIINIKGNSLYGPLYNLLNLKLIKLRKYLDDSLIKSQIKYSISPVKAFIFFILKKDNRLRLYIDYRGLNKIIIKNRYPLPLINKTLDRLNSAI